MMKITQVLIFCLISLVCYSQNKYVNADMVSRVLKIMDPVSGKTGTAFFIERNNKTFVITAKHIIDNSRKNGDYLFLNYFKENQLDLNFWKIMNGNVYFSQNDSIDIAVLFTTDIQTSENHFEININNYNFPLGGKFTFLGYPFGQSSYDANTAFNDMPVPLLKSAFFSGTYYDDKRSLIVLDGHNNPGFSGGPVYTNEALEIESNEYIKKWILVGVISGYESQRNRLRINDSTSADYFENSGIIRVENIKYALEVIDSLYESH